MQASISTFIESLCSLKRAYLMVKTSLISDAEILVNFFKECEDPLYTPTDSNLNDNILLASKAVQDFRFGNTEGF